MLSFMDGFSGYHQIKMAEEDQEKTTFRTPIGNFSFNVMPFGCPSSLEMLKYQVADRGFVFFSTFCSSLLLEMGLSHFSSICFV